jgi:cytochrome oxidase assembly protein ShyY1
MLPVMPVERGWVKGKRKHARPVRSRQQEQERHQIVASQNSTEKKLQHLSDAQTLSSEKEQK